MKVFLENVLPKILPDYFKYNENYFLRAHEGKSDLQKSIPTKINAFKKMGFPVGIIILHDQDSGDCKILKQKLIDLCGKDLSGVFLLVRIVCRELESWYLGDMGAIELAYPRFKARNYKNKAKFRIPDELQNAANELRIILPEFQKVQGAKRISEHITIGNNKSKSFNHFVTGLKSIVEKNKKES